MCMHTYLKFGKLPYIFYIHNEYATTPGEPVLLLMDNCPGHYNMPLIESVLKKHNVRVEFFPPNVTSLHQPCDMGIIAAPKAYYKRTMLQRQVDFWDLEG